MFLNFVFIDTQFVTSLHSPHTLIQFLLHTNHGSQIMPALLVPRRLQWCNQVVFHKIETVAAGYRNKGRGRGG